MNEYVGLFYPYINPKNFNDFDYEHMKDSEQFNAWRAAKTQAKINRKMNNNKTTVLLVVIAIILTSSTILWFKHIKPVRQLINMDNAMEKQPYENDSVTVDIIKANVWRLESRTHIDEHSQHAWKLKSGNYVIRFNYMPDNKYYKWNPGEVVPNELILELLSIDELIHETYNLHVNRQK